MPIRIPSKLPAFKILKSEGVNVMSNADADRQDIRPLKIGLLNLMPLKIQTENQFSRLIGSTPLQIELTLIRMSEHKSKHTSSDHMKSFYKSFEEIKDVKLSADLTLVTSLAFKIIPQFSAILRYRGSLFSNSFL